MRGEPRALTMSPSPLSRRRVLAGLAGAGALAAVSPPSAVAAEPSLAELAAARGILFGSWTRGRSLATDPEFAALVRRECRIIVSGPETQWAKVSPTPGALRLDETDGIVRFAERNGIAFRGHSLVWHVQAPPWFKEIASRAEAEIRVREHILAMGRHFAGRVHSWDVVNEALRPSDGRADRLRKTVFLEKLGPDYLEIAFRTAREADPKALLTYNDFALELEQWDDRERRKRLLALVDDFRRRGVPIDAIGLQSHLATADMPRFNEKVFASFLRELADRGLRIFLTELDVADKSAPADIALRDREVAEAYRRYLSVALDNRAVVAVLTWGLSDRDSWIVRGDQPNHRRTDAAIPRPLPYDADFRRKPAWNAIAACLRAAPAR
jgi:endo-1,4-beta-xylanase